MISIQSQKEIPGWHKLETGVNSPLVGYGDQTPKTQIGKIVTIIYALIGFPLMVICSRNNGIVMANCFRFIYWKCYKCCCGISTSQRHISESFELLIPIFIYALSFYRSQNVLGWSNFFVPDQKSIYICIVVVTNILCNTKR